MGSGVGGGYSNRGEGLDPKGRGKHGDRKRRKGLLTLCLNSDFSSRVMVSALAMTGMMFTTLLRCFMNSRSRGRKLGPREGGVSEPPGPPHSASATTPGAPLGQEVTGLGTGWVATTSRLQNRTQLSTHTWSTNSLSLSFGSGAYPGFL